MRARRFPWWEKVIWALLLTMANAWHDDVYEDFATACKTGVYWYD